MKPELDAVPFGFAAAKANRLDYVDAVRVVLILLVVAHHSVETLCRLASAGDAAAWSADPARMGLLVGERGLFHGASFSSSPAISHPGPSIAKERAYFSETAGPGWACRFCSAGSRWRRWRAGLKSHSARRRSTSITGPI